MLAFIMVGSVFIILITKFFEYIDRDKNPDPLDVFNEYWDEM